MRPRKENKRKISKEEIVIDALIHIIVSITVGSQSQIDIRSLCRVYVCGIPLGRKMYCDIIMMTDNKYCDL